MLIETTFINFLKICQFLNPPVRIMKFRGDYDKVNNKSLVNISANLATHRCIVQINDPNIIIDFSHRGSLYKLLENKFQHLIMKVKILLIFYQLIQF